MTAVVPMRQPLLAAIELPVPGSSRSGRAFVPTDRLGTLQLAELASHFGRSFVEEHDEARLPLLEQALAQRNVVVETYPGESSPVELHAYVRARGVSDAPLFACVLASMAVVEHLVSTPPHVVLETATLQVIGDDVSEASITAGLEAWVRRVWPHVDVPRITLREWPDMEVSRFLSTALAHRWPRMHLTTSPMRNAPELLSKQDFPSPEELARL